MRQDCESCGEYTLCDKHGICANCRVEEQDEQDGEEKTSEDQEDEGEASNSRGSSRSSPQD